METTQKTETGSKNEQTQEGAEHAWGRTSSERVLGPPLTVAKQRGHSSECRGGGGGHARCQVSTVVPEGQTITPNQASPPLAPCSGKGEQAEETVGTRARQMGHPRKARGWHSFPRKVVVGFTISLTEGEHRIPTLGVQGGFAYRWTRLGEVPRQPVGTQQGSLLVCWDLL